MFDNESMEIISEEEVASAIAQCNFQKGIGPDGFDGRLLEMDEGIKNQITKEIKTILNEIKIPDHLKTARLVPLTKIKGSSTAAIQDIRPIMIKSHIFKVMEKSILEKLKSIKSNMLKSGDYQNGFKEQRSTGNNLAQVVQKIHGRNNDKRQSMILIDL